jgi:hypothetical protein
VWKTALNAVHWRDSLRYEISRALAAGCTLEHLAAATGLDHQTIERLRREPLLNSGPLRRQRATLREEAEEASRELDLELAAFREVMEAEPRSRST